MKTLLLIVLLFTFSSAGSWERAIKFVLAHEAGYCHDGGWESNYGLCSKWYPKLSMKTLTQDSATAIYYRDYWCRMNCEIQSDSDFALLIFDTAVLFGQPTAEMIFKKCLYDKDSFMYLRIDMIESIVQQHPEKIRYLATWLKRTYDLCKAVKP
jgi:Glycosyl hydrolase 108